MARSSDLPEIIKWLVIAGAVTYGIYWVQNKAPSFGSGGGFVPNTTPIPGPLNPSDYTINVPPFTL